MEDGVEVGEEGRTSAVHVEKKKETVNSPDLEKKRDKKGIAN